MSELSKELLQPCVVCHKVWARHETEKYVYHISKGVVCKSHHGVEAWYDELIEDDNSRKAEKCL